MKVTPILFTAAMVRAILDGRKTQTRRVIKPQPPKDAVDAGCLRSSGKDDGLWWWLDSTDLMDASPVGDEFRCPYGQPGDRLWVREAWCLRAQSSITNRDHVYYRADAGNTYLDGKWKSSMFMPRWASRITLEITKVRVERVQEISGKDAQAEGVEPGKCSGCVGGDCSLSYSSRLDGELCLHFGQAYREGYQRVWDAINAKRKYGKREYGKFAWDKNPFVWALEFRKI